MNHWITWLLFVVFCFDLHGCDILVSLPPTRFLVKKIAADEFSISVVVPPGLSPHSFEPSAKEMLSFVDAKIWFQSNEGFEKKAASVFPNTMKKVNLFTTLFPSVLHQNEIDTSPCKKGCCHHHSIDSHIWFEIGLLKEQAEIITKSLSELFPEKKELFIKRLEETKKEINDLESQLKGITAKAACHTILVVHPAFDRFCKAFGFKQLSIEDEGKEPSPKYLEELIQKAKEAKVACIYISPQYSAKEAAVLANELGLELISLDPYREDVFDNLKEIAREFSK